MDINFKCPHCQQELSVDESNAGSETQCPACQGSLVIPAASTAPGGPPPPANLNPMASSAAAKEHKHYSVPQREKSGPAEDLITKPLKPLEATAKEGIHIKLKTLRHSDHVEVGKDHFDEHVTKFLNQVGEANIIKVEAITYTHQELASRQWITDYGIIVLYRG